MDKKKLDKEINKEIKRLEKIYENFPEDKKSIAEGLIVEAARLRIRLNYLWEDIVLNGETEMFSQSATTEPYERERPVSKTYTATNKSYQTIIMKLDSMLPKADLAEIESDEFDDFVDSKYK